MATTPPKAPKKKATVTKAQVLAYLKKHPNFLEENADALAKALPDSIPDPAATVVDMRSFVVGHLQNQLQDVKSAHEVMVHHQRDYHSIEQAVQYAVLAMVRARTLEQLLAAVTIDMLPRLEVDVVRVALESPIAGAYGAQYYEENYSGVGLLEPGLADVVMGRNKTMMLVPDAQKAKVQGVSEVWSDGVSHVRSAAYLRMDLPRLEREGILALGTKNAGVFHRKYPAQLLQFLAHVLALRLDHMLHQTGDEEWI